MAFFTSSTEKFDRGITLRVDLTGVLACLFVIVLISCAVLGYGKKNPVDGLVQPIGPKAHGQAVAGSDQGGSI